MAEILRVFTPDQLKKLSQDYLTAQNVNLTDFNEGAVLEAITDLLARVESTTGFDYIKTARAVIPIAFQQGLDFAALPESTAVGYLRFYRLPYFSLFYSSTGTSVVINNDGTTMTFTVTGGPGGEDVSIDLTTYTTVQSVVDYINGLAGAFTATKVQDGNSSDLYNYVSKEMIGKVTYLNVGGFDIVSTSDGLVSVPLGTTVQTNEQIQIITLLAGTIPAGESTSGQLDSESVETGSDQIVAIKDIDTINGFGDIITPLSVTSYAINDSSFTDGQSEESVSSQRERFRTFVAGLARSNRFGIQFYVSQVSGVRSVSVKPQYPIAGYNTVVIDDGTGTASAALITEVEKVIAGLYSDLTNYPGLQAEGLNFIVASPTQDIVTITVTVYRIGETSNIVDIEQSVTTAIEQYVNRRKIGEDVVFSALLTEIKKSHPAIYDVALLINGLDTTHQVDSASVARTGSSVGAPVGYTLTTFTDTP